MAADLGLPPPRLATAILSDAPTLGLRDHLRQQRGIVVDATASMLLKLVGVVVDVAALCVAGADVRSFGVVNLAVPWPLLLITPVYRQKSSSRSTPFTGASPRRATGCA